MAHTVFAANHPQVHGRHSALGNNDVFKSKRFTPTLLECNGQCAENCELGLARGPGLVLTPSPMRSVIQFATGSLLLLPIVNGALGRGLATAC